MRYLIYCVVMGSALWGALRIRSATRHEMSRAMFSGLGRVAAPATTPTSATPLDAEQLVDPVSDQPGMREPAPNGPTVARPSRVIVNPFATGRSELPAKSTVSASLPGG